MQKTYFYRGLFYLMGLLILALGITLNTKTGLGVSPIISVSFSISTIWHFTIPAKPDFHPVPEYIFRYDP